MRAPTLKQLNALVTVLDTRHFGEAARRLGVTQPTLSQQIRMLEENLGGPLIDRAGIVATPVGEEVARRARGVLRDAQDISEVAQRARGAFGGLVRLGVLPTVGPYLLPAVLADLHARFPDLRIHVREDRPDPLMAGLHDGRFDVLVGTLPLEVSWAQERALFSEASLLGVAADHPFAGREQVAARELRGQPMLTLGRGHPLHVATE
ncbi:MAG: LysR substrate-binding domain-containing protein, partial [Pseudomonadota bacterium]